MNIKLPKNFKPNPNVLRLSEISIKLKKSGRINKEDATWLIEVITNLLGTDEFIYPIFMVATKIKGNDVSVQSKKIFGGYNISDGEMGQALINIALGLIRNESFALGMKNSTLQKN